MRTPENIELTYRLAGAGTRGAAYLVDLCVMFCVAFILIQALSGLFVVFEGASQWVRAMSGLLIFTLFHVYFIWFELRGGGMTPGKRALGIRVIKDGGYALGAVDALVRNLMRAVDFLPILNAVGLVSILATERGQRLGDLAAGTLVVHSRSFTERSLVATIPEPKSAAAMPAHQLLRLPADVQDVAVEFFRYAETLVPRYRQALAAAIVELITRTTGLAPARNQSSEGFIAAVIRQAAQDLPATGLPAAGTRQPFSAYDR